MESRAAELLKTYGLGNREALVYLFVLKMGSASAGEIAKALQLRRMEAYRLVKKLTDASIIQANAGKPVTYSAQPVEVVVTTMLEIEGRRSKEMELAKDELLSISQSLPKGKTKASDQQFKIIQGREQIYGRIARMAEIASNSLDLLLTKNDLIQANGVGIADKLAEAASRKVKVRVMGSIDGSTLEAADQLGERCSVRHAGEAQSGRMVIADGSTALSSLVLDDSLGRRNERDVAIYSESQNYAEMLSSLFETAYKAAPDSAEVMERLREGKQFDSRLRALVEVLRATLPDDGWRVKAPGLLLGVSGASFDFTAVASSGGKSFGIDIVVAGKEQDAKDRVVRSVMKKLELPDNNVVVVSTKQVGDEVERLAKLMNVSLVQAPDTLAATSQVRKILKG